MELSQGQFVNQSSFKTNISIYVPSLERAFELYKRKANLFVACLWELQRYIVTMILDLASEHCGLVACTECNRSLSSNCIHRKVSLS